MKKSQLRQIIKEEISKMLNEWSQGDIVQYKDTTAKIVTPGIYYRDIDGEFVEIELNGKRIEVNVKEIGTVDEDSMGSYFANGEGPYLDSKNRSYLDNNTRKPLKNTDHAKHYVHSNVSDVTENRKIRKKLK
tara:strand:- start:199 stop:594 length:396 start_codon:yes stop_codon:yes gene_type:complete